MAQRHQTLFPRRTSGHAHQHGEKDLARETSSGCGCTTCSTMSMEYNSEDSESEHEELESDRSVKKFLLIQPSSAAAERVFSLLKASFGDQQDSCLQDYVQASLMMQYNKR